MNFEGAADCDFCERMIYDGEEMMECGTFGKRFYMCMDCYCDVDKEEIMDKLGFEKVTAREE